MSSIIGHLELSDNSLTCDIQGKVFNLEDHTFKVDRLKMAFFCLPRVDGDFGWTNARQTRQVHRGILTPGKYANKMYTFISSSALLHSVGLFSTNKPIVDSLEVSYKENTKKSGTPC